MACRNSKIYSNAVTAKSMTHVTHQPNLQATRSLELQGTLARCFTSWRPAAPGVLSRGRGDVSLAWSPGPFAFLGARLLYRLERREKIPQWVTVYSGGKTSRTIENLAPGHPHKFRVKVIIKSSAVDRLAELAVEHYGDEDAVYDKVIEINKEVNGSISDDESTQPNDDSGSVGRWLESRWSEEAWTSTHSEGTSAACFCMAVRCGYLTQVQQMLEERPELVGIINSSSGMTPLATAARKGDVNMVRFLVSAGADVDQRSGSERTALHHAVLAGHTTVVELLLEKGADFTARDRNSLRVEHLAVDSCSLEMLGLVLGAGGDVTVRDSNGWTPLFRAVCQGAGAALVRLLRSAGSDVSVVDCAGLSLPAAARLLRNRLGHSRDSILKLVDSQYQHEKALANFTRITKKISSINTLLNLK